MPYGCSVRFSRYGTKVIPARLCDATCGLDAILDKETELLIVAHMSEALGGRA
jgi:hypothetical protein